jgi:radical SAM protein with 4Fe4S-binding SPASM domain
MPKSQDLSKSKMIQLVKKLVDAELHSLTITGGEPLTNATLTTEIIRIAKEAGTLVSLNTNLLLLNSKKLSVLKDAKLDGMLVSCSASDPDMYRFITRCGDYERFKRKLAMLVESGISCMVNMVVSKSNLPFIRSTAKDMAMMGVKSFSATPFTLNVDYPDFNSLLAPKEVLLIFEDLRWCKNELGLQVDVLEPLPRCFYPDWCWEDDYAFTKRSCQAGKMTVSVSNVGDVRPCPHNPMVYGNLFEESFEVIWDKMAMYRDDTNIPECCKGCPSIGECNGACRMNSLATTGKLSERDNLIVGHMYPVVREKIKSEIALSENTLLRFNGKLRSRKEKNGNYSIALRAQSFTIVNEELHRFVVWLESFLPRTFGELKESCAKNSQEEKLRQIITNLIAKGFIGISD